MTSQANSEQAHGAVPAIGQCYGLDTIVDESLEAQPEIDIEAGDHQTLIQFSHDRTGHALKPLMRRTSAPDF